MEINLPTIAGFISTILYAIGTLPMLTKAFRTRKLASYSLSNILLSAAGSKARTTGAALLKNLGCIGC